MRFLKRKIQLKQNSCNTHDDPDFDLTVKAESCSTEPDSELNSPHFQEFLLPMRKPRTKPSCPQGNSKNIVKNYGKALCSFASSSIAAPYLKDIIQKHGYFFVNTSAFMDYIKGKKEGVHSIESLRNLLVGNDDDSQEVKAYKKLFQEISIIFLKYFSVNWIFGGKLMHKKAHLKFRFKMLRRVKNPEHFTYLKTLVN